mgnify:CR=1 FL=1
MIPARGGSKGISRKNLAPLAGKPLIAYTIEAALASRSVERVMVSTEDPEIAGVAREWGAEVPFRRPVELAADSVPGGAVSRHWLEWVNQQQDHPWAVVHLQTTSPLRTSDDIDAAVELLERVDCACVCSVSPVREHPAYMYRLIGNHAEPVLSNGVLPNHRSEVEPLYRLNGAIFATRFEAALSVGQFCVHPFAAYVMPVERSIDIDTPLDLLLAEAILTRTGACTAAKRSGD